MSETAPTTRITTLPGAEVGLGRLRALGLRMKVWWSKDELTRALAEGRASTDSRELALRAGQLTAKSTRKEVADSIEDVLNQASRKRMVLTAQVPIDRRKVRSVKAELAELVARLRSDEPVRPQGMARVLLLLTDVERPLFGDGTKVQLLHAIIDATDRLDPPSMGGWS
jgi:chaperonin cofactor prefoldin